MKSNKKFSGTVDLSDSTRAQRVYGSQAYGTFFNIYISFESQKSKDNSSLLVKKAHLDIVNYNGPINLGLHEIHPPTLIKDRYILLPVEIRGLHSVEKQSIDFPKSAKKKISLNYGQDYFLILQRDLHPLKVPQGLQTKENYFYGQVFDSEFYNRDGIDNYSYNKRNRLPKTPISKITEEYDKIFFNMNSKSLSSSTEILDGHRCMYSVSKILF